MKYYIAYGSNLSVAQMAFRCPNARVVGRAVLNNWKLVFRKHATIERKRGSTVPVLIWAIDDEDERSLDRYEGFPKYYIKDYLPVDVTFKDGEQKRIKAMVYIMVYPRPIIPPTWDYYSIIKSGYKRFQFDVNILKQACREAYFESYPAYATTYKAR